MQIEIDFKTPSVNHLYFVYNNRLIKTKEAHALDNRIKAMVKNLKLDNIPTGRVEVIIRVFEDWYTQKGTVKRKDVANREKFLIDSVFSALGIDDCMIWRIHIQKCQQDDGQEYAIMDIKEIDDGED